MRLIVVLCTRQSRNPDVSRRSVRLWGAQPRPRVLAGRSAMAQNQPLKVPWCKSAQVNWRYDEGFGSFRFAK